jgi:Tol biopolymer transport system component
MPSIPPLGAGGRIAYEVRSGGRTLGLFTIDPDGADGREVGAAGGYLATWSPDASQLAYLHAGNSGSNDLYVINADGTNQRRLTNTPEEEGIPAWSPDGDTIAVAIPTDGDAEIYLLDAETGEILSQLTDNEGIDDYMPAWSPDGRHISYVTKTEMEGSDEIHIMTADGATSTQVTDSAVEDYYPAWAPNGDTIVFVSARVSEQALFLMNVDGSNQRQLTDGKDRDSRPAWSPDGSTIAYHSFVDDGWSIELVAVATGRVTLLAEDGVHPAWSR